MLRFIISFLIFLFLNVNQITAQEITKADYERAVSFTWPKIKFDVSGLRLSPNWYDEGRSFWYTKDQDEGLRYYTCKAPKYIEKPLFDHAKMKKLIFDITGDKEKETKLPLNNIEILEGNYMKVDIVGEEYLINLKSYKAEKSKVKEPNEDRGLGSDSPDGKWFAFRKDHNLFIRNNNSKVEFQLTYDGKEGYDYASYYGWFDKMYGEGGERPDRFIGRWSEDSRYLMAPICDVRTADKMYMLDYSIDTLFRPKLSSYYRGSPGDTNMVYVIPAIFDIENKKKLDIDFPRKVHINYFQTIWSDNPDRIFGHDMTRGFQELNFVSIDLPSGKIDTLINEKSETNIENFAFEIYEDLNQIFFLSERTGWRMLYAYDLETREVKSLTKGEFVVKDLIHVDTLSKDLYFLSSGKEETWNPYHSAVYKVNLENPEPIILTPEQANHHISLSDEQMIFIDNYSSIENPTVTVLRNLEDGSVVKEISKADVSNITDRGYEAPETFICKGRDGMTNIYGAFWKPSNFDASKKYPIIDYSYTGPHTHVYPKDFLIGLRDMNQSLAELGFIVVRIDAMGSTGRFKAFRDVSYKNMGKNLEGHVIWIKALAEKYNWVDIDRVGIFGHSAGGYDAGHAVLEYPDFYKVAVASSADHDFRMEKAWWPEMYMGWPVDEKYHEVSNVTMAPNLKGKLLLVHGSLDDNVNASATFKFAEALIKADKEFDLLIIPSQRHGYKDEYRTYFNKKRWNYFVEHLLGAEPIWDFD